MNYSTEEDVAAGNDGERMVVANILGYHAHMSLYRFAMPYVCGRRVLDAGSGVGYGAAYFARHGASVLALDAGADAIAYSRKRYAGDSVTYEVADLNAPLPLGDLVFETVFSSNVFEHIANVDGLAAECARVVKPNGAVIVAVPPITSAAVMESDMRNQFHVHHIPPGAWHAKLSRYFGRIECHHHTVTGKWKDPDVWQAEIAKPAHEVTIDESDFSFRPLDGPDFEGSISALFVCREPRDVALPETLAERTPLVWREGQAAAKIVAEERAALAAAKAEADGARAALETERKLRQDAEVRSGELMASTSWRITAPLRRIKGAITKPRRY